MRVSIAILPLFILAALIIGVIIYFICYKRRINRALEGQESGAHMPMASMETVVKVVVVIGALVMYSSLSSKITALQNDLTNTRNELTNEIMVLNYELDELEEQLKKEASMVSECTYEFGEIDTKEHQVEVRFSVVPKSYSEDTKLSLDFRGETIALTNNGGGTFTGSKTFPIFEYVYEESVLHITEGDVTKTELLEEVPMGSLCYECMPMLDVLSNSFRYEPGKGTVSVVGTVHVVSSGKKVSMFQDLKLYVMRGTTVVDEIAMKDGVASLDKEYKIKKGESLWFVVKGVDEYGYMHEYFCTQWSTEEGKGVLYVEEPYQVYAPDGSAMFQ